MTFFNLKDLIGDFIPSHTYSDFPQSKNIKNNKLYLRLKDFIAPAGKVLDSEYTFFYLLCDIYHNLLRLAGLLPAIVAPPSIDLPASDQEFLLFLGGIYGIDNFSYEVPTGFILDVSKLDIDLFNRSPFFILDESHLDKGRFNPKKEVHKKYTFPLLVQARIILARSLFFHGNASPFRILKMLELLFNFIPSSIQAAFLSSFSFEVTGFSQLSPVEIYGLYQYRDRNGEKLYIEPLYGEINLRFLTHFPKGK